MEVSMPHLIKLTTTMQDGRGGRENMPVVVNLAQVKRIVPQFPDKYGFNARVDFDDGNVGDSSLVHETVDEIYALYESTLDAAVDGITSEDLNELTKRAAEENMSDVEGVESKKTSKKKKSPGDEG
jgi:hypothetical protein